MSALHAILRALRGLYQWRSIFHRHAKRISVSVHLAKYSHKSVSKAFFFFVPTTCDEIKDKIGERRAPFSSMRCEESAWRCDLLTWLQDYRLQLSRWWRPSALLVFLLLSCGGGGEGGTEGAAHEQLFSAAALPFRLPLGGSRMRT